MDDTLVILDLLHEDMEHFIRDETGQMRRKKGILRIFGWKASKIDEQTYLVSYSYNAGYGERGWLFKVNIVGETVRHIHITE